MYVAQRIRMLEEMGYEACSFAIRGRTIAITIDVLAKSLLSRKQVASTIRKVHPDVIEFYCPATYLAQPGSVLSRYFTVLSYDAPALINFTGRGSSFIASLERRRLQSSTRVISLTRYGARSAITDHGVDESRVCRVSYAAKPHRPQRGSGFALSYCAASKPYAKGLDILANSWSLLGWQMPLVVTGIPEDRAMDFLRRRGIKAEDSIRFPGTVSSTEYASLVSRCDFYVSPARWEEFGQALIDALSWGKPLAVTPSLGPSEIARDIDANMVADSFSPEDLSRAMVRAREMAQGLGFAKSIARRFLPYHWDQMKRNLRRCLGGA
jgi:glycosyltransferase involved in cell wall biosynthesis